MENKKMERLDKIISGNTGISRSDIKKMMKKGRVTVDGEIVKDQTQKVDPTLSEIMLDGEKIIYEDEIYIMMNKPVGYLSATKDIYEKTVIDIVREDIPQKDLFPVGRLDIDTTGLLLITSDGAFSHNVSSPKKNIKKTYEAFTDIKITQSHIDRFKSGLTVEGEKLKPASLKVISNEDEGDFVEIVISEGKYHQVKKMIEEIGGNVLSLNRVAIGSLELDENLDFGEYRRLTQEEMEKIFI